MALILFLSTSPSVLKADFSPEDIIAMRAAGVRIALVGEQAARVVPANLAPTELMKAEILDFNGAAVYTIPDWIFKFAQLRKLDLHNAGLTNHEILKLTSFSHLEVLDLSNNPLFTQVTQGSGSLSKLWVALPELRVLSLSNIGGNAFYIGDLSSLKYLDKLDLSRNWIEDIKPLRLGMLNNLRKLDLSANKLTTFNPLDVPIVSIQELKLQDNSISILPFAGDLPQLGTLNISGNGSVAIDEAYGGLFVLKQISQLIIDGDAQVPYSLRKKIHRNSGYKINGIYHDNQDGTITDIRTKLQWMQCSLGQTFKEGKEGVDTLFQCSGKATEYEWTDVLNTVKLFNTNEGFAGHNDWRIPKEVELKTIVYCSSGEPQIFNIITDGCTGKYTKPTIISDVFPQTPLSWYWASTMFGEPRFVSFYDGSSGGIFEWDDTPVRLVRDGN